MAIINVSVKLDDVTEVTTYIQHNTDLCLTKTVALITYFNIRLFLKQYIKL